MLDMMRLYEGVIRILTEGVKEYDIRPLLTDEPVELYPHGVRSLYPLTLHGATKEKRSYDFVVGGLKSG